VLGCRVMPALDTTPEISDRQIAIYRAMSSSMRLEIGLELTRMSRKILEAGIRSRHGEYTDSEVRWALRRAWLGEKLFRRAYPDAPEIAP